MYLGMLMYLCMLIVRPFMVIPMKPGPDGRNLKVSPRFDSIIAFPEGN